jgi:segregation and condensation protein B
MSLKGAVEAALLAAGGPIPIKELALIVGSPADEVESALKALRSEYRAREGGIEVAYQAGGAWVLQVTKQYVALVQRLVPMELEPALLKTLSLIAFLQPVTQAKVVDQRGAGAYVHVRQLAKRGLIAREREGNSYLLTTTTEFSRRFRLKDDPEAIRQAMIERAKALDQTGIAEQATALVEQLVVAAPEMATAVVEAGSEEPAHESPPGVEAKATTAAADADEASSRLLTTLDENHPAQQAETEPGLPESIAATPAHEATTAVPDEQPSNVTRLSDHDSPRHRIIEALEDDDWQARKVNS